jgi:hypothetical protein
MTSEAVIFQRSIRKQGSWNKVISRPNYLRRFQYFIEKSNWDDVISTRNESINRICIGIIVIGALYFITPVLTILFLR